VITGIAQLNGTPLSAAGTRFAEKIPNLADNFTKIPVQRSNQGVHYPRVLALKREAHRLIFA
jgi:hypothetical protein